MDPNTVFDGINDTQFEMIKQIIDQQFQCTTKELTPGQKASFVLKTTEGNISLHYYSKGKLMLQSSPTNIVYVKLVSDLANKLSASPIKKVETIPKEENEIVADYFIGCDEAGAGESFGSMFLGCAIIHKDHLKTICDIIQGRNIRELSKQEVSQMLNGIKDKFQFDIVIYNPSTIDDNSKNVLLDRGYIKLISKMMQDKTRVNIVIDDYGVRHELKRFTQELKNSDTEIIIKHKADEEYTACKIASLIARQARMEEIDHINKTNSLVEEGSMEMISPGSGAASNPLTEKYLALYRQKLPDAEFPSFVRKKWANIDRIDKKYPRRIVGLIVVCSSCNENLRRIDVMYDKTSGTKFYCTKCSNLISVEHFHRYFKRNVISLDTSTLVSRILSKDLKSNQYFKENDFLLPTYVYEELDTKQPDIKRGAQKEISELVDFKANSIIGFDDIDTHTLASGSPNDKKLLAVLDNRNAAVLTKDRNMASFAEIDHFVFFAKGM